MKRISNSFLVALVMAATSSIAGGQPVDAGDAGSDQSVLETTQLVASDGAVDDWLGHSVAVFDEVVVAGATGDDEDGDHSGSAYVFTEPAGGWIGVVNETAKLLPSDGAAYRRFGFSVAVSGDTIVVGTGIPSASFGPGAAYIFTRPPGGWSGTLYESAKLVPSNGELGSFFGKSVAIEGDTVVVGAKGGDTATAWPGTAYVFTRPAGGWSGTLTEDARLTASDGVDGDGLATSVAISGEVIVAGAREDDPPGSPPGSSQDYGSAYVFTRPQGGWLGDLTEAAKLVAALPNQGARVGTAVAVRGQTIVVGAEGGHGLANFSGLAYVYLEPALGWSGTLTETAELRAANGEGFDSFGAAVAIGERFIVVGAPGHSLTSGSAYSFTEPAGGWFGISTETSRHQYFGFESEFGNAVSISGQTVAIGAFQYGSQGSEKGTCWILDVVSIFSDGFESAGTNSWTAAVP